MQPTEKAQHGTDILHMKKSIGIVCVCICVLQVAQARVGESLQQCIQRYGEPVIKIEGYNSLYGVAVFAKDGIMVTAAFDRTTKKCAAAIYTRGDYRTQKFRTEMKQMTDGEFASLLATVPGRWIELDDAPLAASAGSTSNAQVSGKSEEIASFGKRTRVNDPWSKTSPKRLGGDMQTGTAKHLGGGSSAEDVAKASMQKRSKEVREAVMAFMKAMSLEPGNAYSRGSDYVSMSFVRDRVLASGILHQSYLLPYRQMNGNVFAYLLDYGQEGEYGLIIVNYPMSQPLSSWAEQRKAAVAKRVIEQKKEEPVLQGF